MLQASVEALIKRHTGIDATIVGPGLIKSAIARQMRLHQINDLAAYWQLLQQNQAAVQQLIEVVVVPETWFFRDRSPFKFLVTHCQQLPPRPAPYRILSVPCSTGEEPYSIAMALLQAGIPTTQFTIEGIDISQLHIQKAQAGIYPPFSFRNDDDDLQAKFFAPVGRDYHIQDRVKRLVQFRVGNILQAQTWPIGHCYDIIFCRNLLIYFDQATRQRVLTRLNQLLKPTGRLFVGHAESSLLLNAGWQGVRIPFTFAYQKASQPADPAIAKIPAIGLKDPAIAPDLAIGQKIPAIAPDLAIEQKIPAIAPDPVRANGRSPQPGSPAIADHLAAARQSADRGDFTIAQQLCTQQLQTDPLQPEIHLLLGQIHQAQDQTTIAEAHFTKTLYLQPNCLEALVHLARLKQNQGDRAAADRLYQRIDRLKTP
jgi:chemotaxis protein methyltransferase WspC